MPALYDSWGKHCQHSFLRVQRLSLSLEFEKCEEDKGKRPVRYYRFIREITECGTRFAWTHVTTASHERLITIHIYRIWGHVCVMVTTQDQKEGVGEGPDQKHPTANLRWHKTSTYVALFCSLSCCSGNTRR
jgi:hypothetical protein